MPFEISPVVGTVVPLILSVWMVIMFGWNRKQRRQDLAECKRLQAEREALQRLHAALQQMGDDDLVRAGGDGQVAILADGGFSSAQLPYLAQSYLRASAGGFVGGIYLLEPDTGRQEVAVGGIPAEFADRIVRANMYLFPGGMSGKKIGDVLAIEHKWKPEVDAGTAEWLRIIKGRTKPAVLLVFVSSGGSAALARGPIVAFHTVYPEVPIYFITILDEKTVARARFPEIRDYYAYDNLVTQFIICDNRRFRKASDVGISLFFPGMTVASWLKSDSLDLWNLGAYSLPMNGQVVPKYATFVVHAEMIPVRYIPAFKNYLPELYLTDGAVVEDVIMRVVQRVVTDESLMSVPLPKSAEQVSRVALVAAPIHPSAFSRHLARADEGLEKWRQEHDIDVQVCYTSFKAPMNPFTQEVPLVVVYLQPLAASAYDLDQFALGNIPIDTRFLSEKKRGNDPQKHLEG